MKMIVAFAVLASVLAAPVAAVTINGDTTSGATWTRTKAGKPPTQLKTGSGYVAIPFEATEFHVTASDNYNFLISGAGYDTFMNLYQGAFNPTAQFDGVLISNDDFSESIYTSGFSFDLVAGTSYFAVVTGYDDTQFGAYVLDINGGSGNVSLGGGGGGGGGTGGGGGGAGAVPEPASWAMLIAGFGLTGAAMRRRRVAVAIA